MASHDQFAPMGIPRTRQMVKLEFIGSRLLRAYALRSRSSVSYTRPGLIFDETRALAFRPAAQALLLKAPLAGRGARLRRSPLRRIGLERLCHHIPETFEGDIAVPALRPLLGRDDVQHAVGVEPRRKPPQGAFALYGAERRRSGHVEDELDLR